MNINVLPSSAFEQMLQLLTSKLICQFIPRHHFAVAYCSPTLDTRRKVYKKFRRRVIRSRASYIGSIYFLCQEDSCMYKN